MLQHIQILGLTQTQLALRKMAQGLQQSVQDQELRIAEAEASRIKAAAHTRQERLAARGITVRHGSDPGVVAGGSVPVRTSHGRTLRAGDVFFGAEFGSDRYPQFPSHRGRQGYFFWPTIRHDDKSINQAWAGVLDDLAEDWDH